MSDRLLHGGGVRLLHGGGNRLLHGSGVAPPAGGGSLPPFWALFPDRAEAESPPARRDARARAEPALFVRLPAPAPIPSSVHTRALASPPPAFFRPRAARAAASPPPAFFRPRAARAAVTPAVVEWWTRWHRDLAVRIAVEDEMLMLGGFGRGP